MTDSKTLIERLRPSTYVDDPYAVMAEAANAIKAKDKEIQELREALKPFAEEATNWTDGDPNHALVVEHFDAEEYNRPAFHIGDLRTARAKLEGSGE